MRMLKRRELAEAYGLKPATIASWTRTTDIPVLHCGGAVRYEAQAVHEWIAAGGPRGRRVEPTRDAEPCYRGFPLPKPCGCGATTAEVIAAKRGLHVLRCEGCGRWVTHLAKGGAGRWTALRP